MAYSPMTEEPDAAGEAKPKNRWLRAFVLIAAVLGYMIPMFWLWHMAGWPESFGIHITAHGKVGLLENYYYSYLLLRGPDFVDILTFLYMWLPVVGYPAWLAWSSLRKARP